jgi:hypothetical protein
MSLRDPDINRAICIGVHAVGTVQSVVERVAFRTVAPMVPFFGLITRIT